MREAERLSALIGVIYDAALDAGLWPDVLARCAEFIGGPAAALFSKDAASKTGDVAYYAGIEDLYKHLYFEKYIKLDPLTVGHYFATVEEPVSVGDIIPYDEFLETRAYREWGKPQGFLTRLATLCSNHPEHLAAVGAVSLVQQRRHGGAELGMLGCGQFGDFATLCENCGTGLCVLLDRELALESDGAADCFAHSLLQVGRPGVEARPM